LNNFQPRKKMSGSRKWAKPPFIELRLMEVLGVEVEKAPAGAKDIHATPELAKQIKSQ
jgi:hypothetical protein